MRLGSGRIDRIRVSGAQLVWEFVRFAGRTDTPAAGETQWKREHPFQKIVSKGQLTVGMPITAIQNDQTCLTLQNSRMPARYARFGNFLIDMEREELFREGQRIR